MKIVTAEFYKEDGNVIYGELSMPEEVFDALEDMLPDGMYSNNSCVNEYVPTLEEALKRLGLEGAKPREDFP
jgi:hypothetical protein